MKTTLIIISAAIIALFITNCGHRHTLDPIKSTSGMRDSVPFFPHDSVVPCKPWVIDSVIIVIPVDSSFVFPHDSL